MSVISRQGQSPLTTEDKIRGFASLFRQNLAVFRSKVHWQETYYHIDMHAGCGFNHDVGVIGSPVLFAEIASEMEVPFYLIAIEKNNKAAHELKNNLERHKPNCMVIADDNAVVCKKLPSLLEQVSGLSRNSIVGSVLFDPNNQNTLESGLDWQSFGQLFEQLKRMDVLFNFPGTAMKRIKTHHPDYFSIADVPRSFNKRFWQIRKPISPWQFTTLIGRQTELSENKKLDIVHLDSEPGRQYLKYAEVNKRQYEAWLKSQREIKQQSLFGAENE